VRDIFIDTLMDIAATDPNVMLITGDLGFGVVEKFENTYPSQYINVGVAEQNMTALAAGLALSGKTVFTYSIANFPTLRCLEQIRNDVCYHKANVVAVSIGGGFSYGGLGASHHATEDMAILRALPNMHALVPSDAFEVREATKYLAKGIGAGYLRLDKTMPNTTGAKEEFEYGKARLLRQGSDATLIVSGGILKDALEASDILAEKGISVRILTMPSISAIDMGSIATAIEETKAIFTVEEHRVVGGLGSAVAELVLEMGLKPSVFQRLGIRGIGFVNDVGTQNYMKKISQLDSVGLADQIELSLKV